MPQPPLLRLSFSLNPNPNPNPNPRYRNPKKTVEDPVLDHVQVFWR